MFGAEAQIGVPLGETSDVRLQFGGGLDFLFQTFFNVSDFLTKILPQKVVFLTRLNRERRGTQQNPEGYGNYDFVENYDLI